MQTVLRNLALFPGWTEDPAGHLEDVERLAAGYAKRGHDAAAVLADLDTLAGRIAATEAELSDVEDMHAFTEAAGSTPAELGALAQRAGHLERQRQLYAAVFDAICRQLAAAGLQLTPHQIGGHKYSYQQRQSLAQLTAGPMQQGRLTEDTTAALYHQLTQRGYLRGPYEAFVYYFGPVVHPEAKKPASGLIWAKSPALFAVFALTLAKVMQVTSDAVDCLAFVEAFPGMNEDSLRSAVSRARCGRRATRGKDDLLNCFNEALSITPKK